MLYRSSFVTSFAGSGSAVKKKVFFPHLDGLRTLAFLSVFLVHSFYTEYAHIKNSDIYQSIQWLVHTGNIGVNLFFVLSGFLITYLLLHEEKLKGKIHVPYFYLRRFLRIWPLYYACVAFGFLIEPVIKLLTGQVPHETADPLLFVTFLSNFNNIINGQADAQNLPILWSVAIEEQFYLLWPLLMILFRNQRLLLCLLVISSSVLFRYVYAGNHNYIAYHTFSVVSDLAVGGLLALLCFYSQSFVEWIRDMKKSYILFIYLLGLLFIGIRKELFVTDILLAIRRLITSVFFAFIIVEQCYAQHSPFKLGHHKLFTFWGKYTYGLYCLHFIGITLAKQICKLIGIDDTLTGVLWWQTLLSLLISMLLGYVSYEYYERYFLKLKGRFTFIGK